MEAGDDDTAPMDLVELSAEEPADTDITAPMGHTTRLDDLLSLAVPVTVTDTSTPLPTISRSPVRRQSSLSHQASRPRRRRRAARSVVMILVMAAVGGTGVLAGRLLAASAPAVSAPAGQAATSSATPGASSATSSGAQVAIRRPADALATWAGQISQATGVPVVAVEAYGHAQLVLAAEMPECRLGWTTLAGIGEAASHHGQGDGGTLTGDGRSNPPILGSRTDDAGRARPDTDAGRLDTDATADRPVGPMQLLPDQWTRYLSDGDQDGESDPYDIDDASLATARLLCDGAADLSQPNQWNAALGRLRTGSAFARAVFVAADGYGTRTGGTG